MGRQKGLRMKGRNLGMAGNVRKCVYCNKPIIL